MANEFITRNGLISLSNATVSGSLNVSGSSTFSGSLNVSGTITANTIVKTGGTSSQFLKADGSVDNTVYAPVASPTLVTPNLGTPSVLVGTNISGTAPGLTAGNVTTNANLTGDVTSVGNATTIANTATGGNNIVTALNSATTGTIPASRIATLNQNTTGSAASLTTARNIQGVSFNGTADINPVNGTGFVKASGTTLSYDNSTYLTTSSAASTYAPLASPVLTGTPTSPTAAAGTNTTQLATTAFVQAALPSVPVSSVFGRTGAVVAQAADYAGFYPSLSGSYSNPSWLTAIPYSILSGTVPTWNQNTTGTAANGVQWNGYTNNLGLYCSYVDVNGLLAMHNNGVTYKLNIGNVQSWLGLQSAAYKASNAFMQTNFNNGAALTNLNTSNTEGTAFWTTTTTNIPVYSFGSLLNIDGIGNGSGNGWNNQLGFTTANAIYFRQSINNNTSWTSWDRIITTSQLGSNAYTSTSYLPLAGGTLTGNLSMTGNTIYAYAYSGGAGGITTSGAIIANNSSNPQIQGNGTTLNIAPTSAWNNGISALISLGLADLNMWSNAGMFLFRNSAGTPIMTLVSTSGNLLIGTTTDNGNKLQVNGNATVSGTIAAASMTLSSGNPLNLQFGNLLIGTKSSAQGGTDWGPYNWPTYQNGIDFGFNGYGSLTARGGLVELSFNGYFDGSVYRYKNSSDIALISGINSSGFYWNTATATGTAGSVASFSNVMTLNNGGNLSVSGTVYSSGAGGFSSSTYQSGRNPIWRFGNADGYGLSYFQGGGGFSGLDGIGIHFGTPTTSGSQFQFISNGNFNATGNASVNKLYATAGADMGSSKITSVASGTSTNDAVNFGQLLSLLPTRTDGYLLGSYDGGVPIYVGRMSVANAKIIFTPSSGGTVNLINNYLNIFAPLATISTLTLHLPSSPNEGDRVVLKFTQAITSITYTNGAVAGNPTTAAKGNEWSLTYDSSNEAWY